MYKKDFNKWNKVKIKVNHDPHRHFVRAGEVRWALIGVNVGSEIDGREPHFTRPVLIIYTISSRLTLVVPMSTKIKNYNGYYLLEWKHGPSALNISHLKVISNKRILGRKGKISERKLREIKNAIKRFYDF